MAGSESSIKIFEPGLTRLSDGDVGDRRAGAALNAEPAHEGGGEAGYRDPRCKEGLASRHEEREADGRKQPRG
jgi:hypothetical protein